MNVDDLLQPLPEDSPFRAIIPLLLSPTQEDRDQAVGLIREHRLTTPYWEVAPPKDEATAVAVLRAATELEFPPEENPWDRRAEELVFTLLGSSYPSIVELARKAYPDAPPRMHVYLLTLLASAKTEHAAGVLAELVETHGWPESIFSRLESELMRNVEHARAFVPRLLESASAPPMLIGNLLLSSLQVGSLDGAIVSETRFLRELGEHIERLFRQLAEVRERGIESDEDANVERQLALFLGIAGWAGPSSIVPVLRKAAAVPEMWPATFALASLIRRGETVEDTTIENLACDDVVRAPLYQLLSALDATDRIPAKHRTRDAFARADMVRWLASPTELGRAPDELELMTVFEAQREGDPVVLYVWRFRLAGDPWLASVSGTYPASAPEGPLSGSDTFSRFEEWKTATAEVHAIAILENLAEWRKTGR